MTKVTSLDHLKELALDDVHDFFIQLNGARSSKHIQYDEDGIWDIYNEIDDSEQTLNSDTELANNTLIVEAIEKGALYAY